jgi:uncharacterized protein
MTETCGFLGKSAEVQDFQVEFNALSHEFNREITRHLGVDAMSHIHYYPRSVTINCAAVGKNSMIFGPDGKMYKCCLEVGDASRAHDQISFAASAESSKSNQLPIIQLPTSQPGANFAPDRWDNYNPFAHERCSQCQYLPVCMAGCPKTRMDKNEYYIKLASEYWEQNIERVIKSYFDAQYAPVPV